MTSSTLSKSIQSSVISVEHPYLTGQTLFLDKCEQSRSCKIHDYLPRGMSSLQSHPVHLGFMLSDAISFWDPEDLAFLKLFLYTALLFFPERRVTSGDTADEDR
jgi:hypothetical protein